MEKKMKLITVVVLVAIISAVPICYALLTTLYSFQNTLTIKGVGVAVLAWISDSTSPTTQITSNDWGKLAVNQTAYSVNLCIKNTGTEKLALSFNTTLLANYGTVTWQIERMNGASTWDWVNLNSYFGTSNPLQSGVFIGNRPVSPNEGSFGHIRVVLTIATGAPNGAAPNFDISVYGVEVP